MKMTKQNISVAVGVVALSFGSFSIGIGVGVYRSSEPDTITITVEPDPECALAAHPAGAHDGSPPVERVKRADPTGVKSARFVPLYPNTAGQGRV